MKMRIGKYVLLALAGISLAACSKGGNENVTKTQEKLAINQVNIGVTGYEWGPSVSRLVLELNQEVESLSTDKLEAVTAGVKRNIKDAYLSDANGEKVKGASQYVTLDLEVTYTFMAEDNASPFVFNFTNMMNEWAAEYPVKVTGLTIGDNDLSVEADAINSRVIPETTVFNVRDKTTGNYRNPLTGKDEEVTLHYAAFEPEHLKESNAKSPLVIWLHGQGEGGTDTDITLLGNEVVALAREEIQSHYTATGNAKEKGAYVLAVQTPTYWMDEGDGTNGAGAGVSRYTEALMDTIDAYVKSNPDIDTNRIYLGGCSNGGYMTMNMAIHYPDYFAAAYPIAEAYSYYEFEKNPDGTYVRQASEENPVGVAVQKDTPYFTEDKLNKIKDLPMWFVTAQNDDTVKPATYTLPTYQAMVKSGAQNKWFSYYETVEGADIEGNEYMGHWSWIYFFNNEVTGVQDVVTVKNAADVTSGFKADNATKGGSDKAIVNGTTYDNIFDWMNAQTK
ncbi:prolyl oligopeptidase family serine peptidase [Streptococcus sp. S784/96/1]|uniref:prolyl oligopeptidase family serine peptidase n=1 Tax=Streptococcus sp. S784/96/1 TaxID=2653499 RepID=UPI001389812F|nr:prolyl oligopeptidase family serine peptidase [Streptococcus sp. S784/96/1]